VEYMDAAIEIWHPVNKQQVAMNQVQWCESKMIFILNYRYKSKLFCERGLWGSGLSSVNAVPNPVTRWNRHF
jgi:hypothetical protein